MILIENLVPLIRDNKSDGNLTPFENAILDYVTGIDGRVDRPKLARLIHDNPIVRPAWQYASDIFDGVECDPPTYTIHIPADVWLSALLPDLLPLRTLLICPTGKGKSYAMTQLRGRVIIACSSVVSAAQLGEIDGVSVWYEGRHETGRIIATTYESLGNVINELDDVSDVTLVIDEIHNIASASFRKSSIKRLAKLSERFQRVIAMTGTAVNLPAPFNAYTTVNVDTPIRTQPATFVRWQSIETSETGKERTRGNKSLTAAKIASDVARDGRCIVFLNNKRKGLSHFKGLLGGYGIEQDAIGIFNSDEKQSEIGQSIIDSSTVGDNVKVLIVTSVAIESINISGKWDGIIALSPLHPALHQQLANRLRDETAHYYILSTSNGKAINGYNVDAQIETLTTLANEAADLANKFENADGRQRNSVHMKSMYIVRDRDTGRWVADPIAVTMQAFRNEQTYYVNSPVAMKAYLDAHYKWEFTEDETIIVERLPKEQHETAAEIQTELETIRIERYNQHIETVAKCGAENIDIDIMTGGLVDPLLRSVVDRVRQIENGIGELLPDGKTAATWAVACEIAAENGDKSSKHKRTVKALWLGKLERDGDTLATALFEAFTIGDAYTKQERYETILDCYITAGYRFLLTPQKRHYWTDEKTAAITDRHTEALFNSLFDYVETEKRIDGKRTRLKRINTRLKSQYIENVQISRVVSEGK